MHRMANEDGFTSARILAASPAPTHVAPADVRRPKHAGRLYPESPLDLRRATQALVPNAAERVARGLVLPHGPLTYTGSLIAAALAVASPAETVVILAPNHAGVGPRAAITSHGAYALPGAVVPIEEHLAESIRGLGGLTDDPAVFEEEHAIESILPLLVAARPRVSIVPILMHDANPAVCGRIGAAIADAVVGRGGGITIVATTDLAHYAPADEADAIVAPLLESVCALDEDATANALVDITRRSKGAVLETCGASTLITAVHALRLLHSPTGVVTARAKSSDVPGDRGGAVVAYASIVF